MEKKVECDSTNIFYGRLKFKIFTKLYIFTRKISNNVFFLFAVVQKGITEDTYLKFSPSVYLVYTE